jgi:hypothetical protein
LRPSKSASTGQPNPRLSRSDVAAPQIQILPREDPVNIGGVHLDFANTLNANANPVTAAPLLAGMIDVIVAPVASLIGPSSGKLVMRYNLLMNGVLGCCDGIIHGVQD